MLVRAKVVKRNTSDGVEFLFDEVPIGFIYFADPQTRTFMEWYSLVHRKSVIRESIEVYGSALKHPRNTIGFMPTELLDIECVTVQEEQD